MHTFVISYCSLLVRVSGERRTGVEDDLTDVFVQGFNPECVVFFRPGYGNQNYNTCFAHVTQGFICLNLLLPSNGSFIAMLLPLLAARVNTAERQHTTPGWLQAETALSAKGLQQRAQQQFTGKCKQEVYCMLKLINLDLMTA